MSSDQDPSTLFRQATQAALEKIRSDREGVPPRIQELLTHLEKALFDPGLNVGVWKRACGVRDNTVMVQFHQWIGQTPRGYIELLRCETAMRLLRDTHLEVWRIAHLLGYSSLGVFSKAFLRRMGQRPRAYRLQYRDQGEASPFDARTLGEALAGTLSNERARELIETILNLYPEVAEAIGDGIHDGIDGDEGTQETIH